jgi:chromosome segregation ATPase
MTYDTLDDAVRARMQEADGRRATKPLSAHRKVAEELIQVERSLAEIQQALDAMLGQVETKAKQREGLKSQMLDILKEYENQTIALDGMRIKLVDIEEKTVAKPAYKDPWLWAVGAIKSMTDKFDAEIKKIEANFRRVIPGHQEVSVEQEAIQDAVGMFKSWWDRLNQWWSNIRGLEQKIDKLEQSVDGSGSA